MPVSHMERQFEIPEVLRFEETSGGLVRALITTPDAEAEICTQGAHLTRWIPRGQRPVLFTSSRSLYEPGKAIRGGVPIVFPWFGPRGGGLPAPMQASPMQAGPMQAGPMHGFARTSEWKVVSAGLSSSGQFEMTFSLSPSDACRALGFSAFRVLFRVAVGPTLEMDLEVHNESGEPLAFEEALHTYFAIGDVHQVSVTGLENTAYVDKTDGFREKRRDSAPIRIGKETDEVYLNTSASCVIHDPAWSRRVTIAKTGSHSTVVWNPWIEKSRTLADMDPEEWREMLCVETANVASNAITLAAGASCRLAVEIRVD
jgi:glucose-6-phosphate 1-epimerase